MRKFGTTIGVEWTNERYKTAGNIDVNGYSRAYNRVTMGNINHSGRLETLFLHSERPRQLTLSHWSLPHDQDRFFVSMAIRP